MLNELIPNDANVELVLDELVPKAAGTCGGVLPLVSGTLELETEADDVVEVLPLVGGTLEAQADDGAEELPLVSGTLELVTEADDGAEVLPLVSGSLELEIEADDGAEVLPLVSGALELETDADDGAEVLPLVSAKCVQHDRHRRLAQPQQLRVLIRACLCQ